MNAAIASTLFLCMMPSIQLPIGFWQVSPANRVTVDGEAVEMKIVKTRAAVIIHGMQLYPIRPEKAAKPQQHDYQMPKSLLVEALSADFDVYALSYAQTIIVDGISVSEGVRSNIEKLRAAGYKEIVLVGHSAGGMIARHFVERYPKSGVTKVIEVCAPNLGSEFATINLGLPKLQIPIIKSLDPKTRINISEYANPLSKEIEFVCVVCKVRGIPGDTLVGLDSQWPIDLQKQGIPASLVAINHFDAMKASHSVNLIGELAREKLVRWTPEQVETGRQILFGREADMAAIKKADVRERPLLKLLGKKLADR